MKGDRSGEQYEQRLVGPADLESVELDHPFDLWVADHYEAVYRYAYRLSGNQQTAEDLTQQVFLNAWRHQDQLRNPERSQSWLLTITRNQFLKQLRKAVPESFSQWELGSIDMVVEAEQDHNGVRLEIQELLLQLPADYRVVVLMFFFEGLSYREIAAELEIKIGTVMSRLSRAKQRLRVLWDSDQISTHASTKK